jgi:hypothetical protein
MSWIDRSIKDQPPGRRRFTFNLTLHKKNKVRKSNHRMIARASLTKLLIGLNIGAALAFIPEFIAAKTKKHREFIQ